MSKLKTNTVKSTDDKFIVPLIKNLLRMLVACVVASLLLVWNPIMYLVDVMMTVIVLLSFSILRDLSQSTKLYGDYFKGISKHNLIVSILIYISGVLGPGVLYIIQNLITIK